MKSENQEICLDVMVSHVDAVIKSWEDYAHFIMMMFTKLKHLTRSIYVIVYDRVSKCIFWMQLFYMISYAKKKSLYQSRTARWNLKLCSCQLLYLRLFSILKYYYKLSNLKS